MKRQLIIAACLVVLLSGCEPSKDATSNDAVKASDSGAKTSNLRPPATPTKLPPDATSQDRVEALKKRQSDYLNVEASVTPTPEK